MNAIEIYERASGRLERGQITSGEYDQAIAVLKDVEPVVHANWILKHIGAGHYWECSACRTNPCIYVTENTKFCPNCGAKMDGA